MQLSVNSESGATQFYAKVKTGSHFRLLQVEPCEVERKTLLTKHFVGGKQNIYVQPSFKLHPHSISLGD